MDKEKTQNTNINSNNKLIVMVIILLTLIALLSSIIFMVNHRDNNNSKVTANISGQSNNNVCITITDDMLTKSINEYKDFGALNIKDSMIYGLKEITVKKTGEVFYSNCDGSLLFVGAIIDKTGKNLTKDAIDKAVKNIFEEKTKNIDKSIAVKMGKGTHELIVFTDPDCPYCRAAEAMFAAKPINAVRYVFFTPLDSIHPDAAKKAVHILCSANPAKELMKVMKNEITEFPNQCDEGKKKLEQHRKLANELGVSGTPTFYLNGQRFIGADPKMYEITGFEDNETDNKNKE